MALEVTYDSSLLPSLLIVRGANCGTALTDSGSYWSDWTRHPTFAPRRWIVDAPFEIAG